MTLCGAFRDGRGLERGVFEGGVFEREGFLKEGTERNFFFLTEGVRDFMSSLSTPPAPKRLKGTPKTDGKVVDYHDERQEKIIKSLPHELVSVEGIMQVILHFDFQIHEWVVLNERMTVGRSYFHTVLYGEKLFVIGGNGIGVKGKGESGVKSVEYLNLKDLKRGWEVVDAEMAYKRSFDDGGWGNPFKAVLIGRRLFVSGGGDKWKNGFLEEKEEFLDLNDLKQGWKTANGLASLLETNTKRLKLPYEKFTNTKHLKLPHEKFKMPRKNFSIAKYEKKMFVLGGEKKCTECKGDEEREKRCAECEDNFGLFFTTVKYLTSVEYLRLAY